MIREVQSQAKIGVGIERLWNAFAKNLSTVIPKIIPNLVKNVVVIEGDGGNIGTVFLFNFLSAMSYQKEKIVELDESIHKFGLQVIEGGHLNLGFSSYKTTFQLTAIEEHKTFVNVKVYYESEVEENTMPAKTIVSALAFISSLESYLQKGSS